MHEININYSDWKHNILTTQEHDAKSRWSPKVTSEFLPHIIPILAAIPLVRLENGKISSEKTYKALEGTVVKTVNGTIDGNQVQSLLWCLAKLPRGKLMPSLVQTKQSTYASFTPLALYAQKLHNNIMYSEWDQNVTDRYLAIFLGLSLFDAFASIKKMGVPLVDALKARELRKESLTIKTGQKAGEISLVTSNKCNLKKLPARTGSDIEDKLYNKYIIMMTLQTWLANAQCRNVDSMLLDLNDWDNIPKAIDAGIPKVGDKKPTIIKEDIFSIDDI